MPWLQALRDLIFRHAGDSFDLVRNACADGALLCRGVCDFPDFRLCGGTFTDRT